MLAHHDEQQTTRGPSWTIFHAGISRPREHARLKVTVQFQYGYDAEGSDPKKKKKLIGGSRRSRGCFVSAPSLSIKSEISRLIEVVGFVSCGWRVDGRMYRD